MNWLFLAILSAFLVALSSLLQRALMKEQKSDPFAYGLVFQLTAATFAFIVAFLFGFVIPPLNELAPNLIITTLFYAAFTIFLLKAFQTEEASKVTILTSTNSLWTILVALFFLGESFSISKALGTLLILAAVVLISYKRGMRFELTRGNIYALLAAFFFGVAFANDAFILRKAEALSYTAISFTLPSLAILAWNPKLITKMKVFFNPSTLGKMMTMSVFYSSSAITIYLAYQHGGTATQLAPISVSRIIITVFLAAIFLGERGFLLRKLFGASLVSIGILLLK